MPPAVAAGVIIFSMFEVLGDIPASVFKEEPGDVFAVPTIVSGNTVAKARLRERTICFLLSDILP